MKGNGDAAAALADYVYKLESVERVNTFRPSFYQQKTWYGLLLVREGDGEIVIAGRSYSFKRHKAFIIPPGSLVVLHLASSRPGDFYYMQFYALQAAAQGHFEPAQLECPEELNPAHFQLLIGQAQEMESKHRSGRHGWDAMKANIIFQELLASLFIGIQQERRPDITQAIRLTIDYIDRYFQLDITREQLAGIAGLNPEYYSRAFKKQTQKSPMEYLAEVRIYHAKQLLVQSDESFRTIARNVGFSDEFYFSRKFKAKTGFSPAAFVKNMRASGKIVSLNHVTTGHLIALNIEPYAAVINSAFPVVGKLENTIAIGHSVPDLERIITIRPELILSRGNRTPDKSHKEQMIGQIAPTVTLDYTEDWRAHFQKIAKIVGREKDADSWLERYEEKAEAIRKQLKSKLGEETVLIVGVGGGKLCVYGQRNIGTVLYRDLQLAAPEGVLDIAHFKEIQPADLAAMDADRILLTSFRHDGNPHMDDTVRSQLHTLFASSHWQSLRAVRNNRVYGLLDSRHLFTSYNAHSHGLFLDKAPLLLLGERQ